MSVLLDALAAMLGRGRPRWLDVVQRLAYWPEEPDAERATEMVEAAADRLWHPRDRGLTRVVMRQLADGVVRPYLRVVRVIDANFPDLDVHGRMATIERMCDVGVRELYGFEGRVLFGDHLIELLAERITGLRFLRLSQSQLSVDTARVIATSPAFAALEELSLHSNVLDDEAVEVLLASPQLAGLRALNLYDNRISDAMVARLRAHAPWQGAKLVLHGQGQR